MNAVVVHSKVEAVFFLPGDDNHAALSERREIEEEEADKEAGG